MLIFKFKQMNSRIKSIELSKQLNENFCEFKKDLPYEVLGSDDLPKVYKDFYESQLKLLSKPTLTEFLNGYVCNCDLFSNRLKNCLSNLQIDLVKDILCFSRQQLLMCRNFGTKSLNELESVLESYDLYLDKKACV